MKGYLVLETEEIWEGLLPYDGEKVGEVVFNTSHSGYEEIATDPSYCSQIVVMTAPMMGNYGVSPEFWESKRIWIEGFICVQLQSSERDSSWKDLLKKHSVPILTDVDTRSLVHRLRSGGTPWGAIVSAKDSKESLEKARALFKNKKPTEKDWVFLASRKSAEDISGDNPNGPRIAILDFGSKENIIRELKKRCSALRIYNSRTPVREIAGWQPDGLMLTNGPGDPADVQVAPGTVKELLGQLPIFGICMGHQILSLALGAKTYKLPFGHRGSNHPIKDMLLDKIYMTAQNHGYAVDPKTLPTDVKVTHLNLNDQTVAGIYDMKRKVLGIQYHPESHPGPNDAVGLFDFFIDKMVRSS